MEGKKVYKPPRHSSQSALSCSSISSNISRTTCKSTADFTLLQAHLFTFFRGISALFLMQKTAAFFYIATTNDIEFVTMSFVYKCKDLHTKNTVEYFARSKTGCEIVVKY
jgi:hypothetical protein